MKILIAIEIPTNTKIVAGVFRPKFKGITAKQLQKLKKGEIISFHKNCMKEDHEEDYAFEAEFHGVLEK